MKKFLIILIVLLHLSIINAEDVIFETDFSDSEGYSVDYRYGNYNYSWGRVLSGGIVNNRENYPPDINYEDGNDILYSASQKYNNDINPILEYDDVSRNIIRLGEKEYLGGSTYKHSIPLLGYEEYKLRFDYCIPSIGYRDRLIVAIDTTASEFSLNFNDNSQISESDFLESLIILDEYEDATNGFFSGFRWESIDIDLTEYKGSTISLIFYFKAEFRVNDLFFGSQIGPFIDNVSVTGNGKLLESNKHEISFGNFYNGEISEEEHFWLRNNTSDYGTITEVQIPDGFEVKFSFLNEWNEQLINSFINHNSVEYTFDVRFNSNFIGNESGIIEGDLIIQTDLENSLPVIIHLSAQCGEPPTGLLSIIGPIENPDLNHEFEVDIIVNTGNISNLFGVACDLIYNPLDIIPVSISHGDGLTENGQNQVSFQDYIDYDENTIIIGSTCLQGSYVLPPQNSNEHIATIRFRTLSYGQTNLVLNNTGLINQFGESSLGCDTEDLAINVTPSELIASLSFNNNQINTSINNDFEVDLMIDNVENLFAFACDVEYDSDKISINEIIYNDALGETSQFLMSNNNDGLVTIGITRLNNSSQGVDINDISSIFTINATANSPGDCDLLVTNIGLLAPDAVTSYNYANNATCNVSISNFELILNIPETFSVDEDESLNINMQPYFSYNAEYNEFFIFEFEGNDNIEIDYIDWIVTIEPYENWNGTQSVEMIIKENNNSVITSTNFEIEVNSINDSPQIALDLPDISVNQGQLEFDINLDEIFIDIDHNDELYYSVEGYTNIFAFVNQSMLFLRCSPYWSGTETITINASDGIETVSSSFIVTVEPIVISLEVPEVSIFVENNLIHIEWQAVNGASSYKVFSTTNPMGLDFNDVTSEGTFQLYSNTIRWQCQENTNYKFYKVKASTD